MESSERISKISKRLSQISVDRYSNPYTTIEWPETLDDDALCFSENLMSLSELPIFNELTSEQKRRLALYEAVNFFSLNISGERELITGLSQRLYKNFPQEITDYIHHFLDEENKHMVWFGTFSEKYGGKVYPDKKVTFPREYAEGEQEFLFFAKVVVFEEIVDQYNVAMANDETLDPLVRQINAQHHADETRHLAFGREVVCYLKDKFSPKWSDGTKEGISDYLKNYIFTTWREYFNPDMYIDAGFENAFELREQAWKSKREFRERLSEKFVRFFQKNGIIEGELKL